MSKGCAKCGETKVLIEGVLSFGDSLDYIKVTCKNCSHWTEGSSRASALAKFCKKEVNSEMD